MRKTAPMTFSGKTTLWLDEDGKASVGLSGGHLSKGIRLSTSATSAAGREIAHQLRTQRVEQIAKQVNDHHDVDLLAGDSGATFSLRTDSGLCEVFVQYRDTHLSITLDGEDLDPQLSMVLARAIVQLAEVFEWLGDTFVPAFTDLDITTWLLLNLPNTMRVRTDGDVRFQVHAGGSDWQDVQILVRAHSATLLVDAPANPEVLVCLNAAARELKELLTPLIGGAEIMALERFGSRIADAERTHRILTATQHYPELALAFTEPVQFYAKGWVLTPSSTITPAMVMDVKDLGEDGFGIEFENKAGLAHAKLLDRLMQAVADGHEEPKEAQFPTVPARTLMNGDVIKIDDYDRVMSAKFAIDGGAPRMVLTTCPEHLVRVHEQSKTATPLPADQISIRSVGLEELVPLVKRASR